MKLNQKYIRFIEEKSEENLNEGLEILINFKNLVFFALNEKSEKNENEEKGKLSIFIKKIVSEENKIFLNGFIMLNYSFNEEEDDEFIKFFSEDAEKCKKFSYKILNYSERNL